MRCHVQAAELQKLSEKLEQQLKLANDQIAHSESDHASSVAQHIKRLEDKEVSPNLSASMALFLPEANSRCPDVSCNNAPIRLDMMHNL